MKCIWQMDGDKVKGFKCDFSPIDMLTIVSGLKYIEADTERHPKDRERAQMIYNKIMLARYTDEQDRAEEFVNGLKALNIIEADRKTEPQSDDIGDCNICKYVGLEHRCNICINGSRFCKIEDEPQIDGYMTAEQTEDYRKMLDKAEHKVYGNIEDEPQTDCSWK